MTLADALRQKVEELLEVIEQGGRAIVIGCDCEMCAPFHAALLALKTAVEVEDGPTV